MKLRSPILIWLGSKIRSVGISFRRLSLWRRDTGENHCIRGDARRRDLAEAGREAGLRFASRKGRQAAAHLSGRRQLGETASDVITARSQLQRVAAASAHGELVAAAAAWNCGGCVCPSAAGREAEGRGGEGRPVMEVGGGLRALSEPPPTGGPGAFPALY